jgi:ElaB/YqjD/DUF883 family membrane-anchored ribosome-binding protein
MSLLAQSPIMGNTASHRPLADQLRRNSLAEKHREFASGVDGLVRHVIDAAGSDISRVRAAGYVALTAANCLFQDGTRGARAVTSAADTWVRRNPWTAVGIGAFVGALAGAIHIRRRWE